MKKADIFGVRARPFGNEGDRLAGEKKVRDFVWQHWTEKKRGYIKISCGHIDTSGTIHYFVEPNEKGEWSVAIRSLYKHDLPKYNKQPIKDITAVSVERIENKADGNSNWTLIFKTIDGEIVEKFPFFNF